MGLFCRHSSFLRYTGLMTRMIVAIFILFLGLLWPQSHGAYAEVDNQNLSQNPLLALQRLDQRVHEIGYRLILENSMFCGETMQQTGLSFHHLSQYGNQETARYAFEFKAPNIALNSIVRNSAAARAGLQANDNLLTINGRVIDIGDYAPSPNKTERRKDKNKDKTEHLVRFQEDWQAALSQGKVTLSILRKQERLNFTLNTQTVCKSRFQVEPSKKRYAAADGLRVYISSTLTEYTANDDELAAILAHEIAHNILRHPARLNQQKVNRGFFGQFGKSAGRIKVTEIEADRLSVWLMANAGFNPDGAITFWKRYGKKYGKGIFSASTHYRWKKRVKLFEEEMAKIAALQPHEGKYQPPLLAFVTPQTNKQQIKTPAHIAFCNISYRPCCGRLSDTPCALPFGVSAPFYRHPVPFRIGLSWWHQRRCQPPIRQLSPVP